MNYNFSLVSYGYETWSLTLRGEHRSRTFKNKVPKLQVQGGKNKCAIWHKGEEKCI